MSVLSEHVLSPYCVSGSVASAANPTFGLGKGVLAGGLVKKRVCELLLSTTIDT